MPAVGCDNQAVSKVKLRALEKVPVTIVPRPRIEISLQGREADIQTSELREYRDGRTNGGIQIGVGTAPVSTQKSIRAVMGNRHVKDRDISKMSTQLGH